MQLILQCILILILITKLESIHQQQSAWKSSIPCCFTMQFHQKSLVAEPAVSALIPKLTIAHDPEPVPSTPPTLQPTSFRSIFIMVPYIATSKTFPYRTSIGTACDYFNPASYSYLIFPPFLTNLYLCLFFKCLSFLLPSHLRYFCTDFHTYKYSDSTRGSHSQTFGYRLASSNY